MRNLSRPDQTYRKTSAIENQTLENKLLEQSFLVKELVAENEILQNRLREATSPNAGAPKHGSKNVLSRSQGDEKETAEVLGTRHEEHGLTIDQYNALKKTICTLKQKLSKREAKHLIALKQMRYQIETLESGRCRQSMEICLFEEKLQEMMLALEIKRGK